MDAKDHGEQSSEQNGICRLEWIAWAIDAARRHKEEEQRDPPPRASTHLTPLKSVAGRE
ncbi:MAG TPA: hypothetical protein VIQ99_00765 [Gammaproteobacteria bacterium]